jgi:spore maturation protein CgeB
VNTCGAIRCRVSTVSFILRRRALEILEQQFGARRARALYCSFDPDVYRPVPSAQRWDLGYMEPTAPTGSRLSMSS